MTIEELVGKSDKELCALTVEELNKYFEPYLKVTRPELAEKPEKSKAFRVDQFKKSSATKKMQAMEILKKYNMGHIKL